MTTASTTPAKETHSEWARIRRAVDYVQGASYPRFHPDVGVVLGSGLGNLVEQMEVETAIPYASIPEFLPSTVEGHAGRLCLGTLAGVKVAVMQGRVHLYEGHAAADVVLPIRVLGQLGAKTLVITNAAGGVNATFRPGDLMLITDHLNLTGTNPLVGPNPIELGPRFPDMTRAYDPALREVAKQVGQEIGVDLVSGVYAGLLGPSYETPGEVKMLRALGADAVGMSTVLEVIAARHMGASVLGISCISNLAADLSPTPLTHDEVKETAARVESRMFALIAAFVARVHAAKG